MIAATDLITREGRTIRPRLGHRGRHRKFNWARARRVLLIVAVLVVIGAVVTGCSDTEDSNGAPIGPVLSAPPDPVPPPAPAPPPPPVPTDTIYDGTHEVLVDIQAGRYHTTGARLPGIGSCFWYRLSGTGGTRAEIIASGMVTGPTTVTIWPSDKAFKTEFCEPWTRRGDTP